MSPATSTEALIDSDLPGLKLVSKGKVRDIYETSDPNRLLFVATDRISAYDVIMKNGVPGKGRILTQISILWFDRLQHITPTHFVTGNIDEMPEEVQKYKDQLEGRVMLVKKAKVIPLEAIVRGYLSGSAWSEYKKSGTVHKITMPSGLVESQKLTSPLFTPSTKAEIGEHDENISPEQGATLVGEEVYNKLSTVALELYKTAADYALTKGLILADTKFEFGVDLATEEVILIDEVLTPDSSRYWPVEQYEAGRPQPSFDKQYLRDWLTSSGFKKGQEDGLDGNGWEMTPAVVEGTKERYEEAWKLLTSD
ncbi:phosphoribosylaminoimidazole-succinocarboxamide synthase [Thelephora terrestris]|uniref:Phosphoribosylaminoimidazole-succinocarboxamide synthase n=1 Tax=Thelephora terrestris TaxID=56493 RepID=A0A9P6L1K8_9AGAM|nr:phosphoribosylaminoimidazole-succinocarboxamide synthase [Thelephora terrestris]